jgi:hypothetical protein
VTNWIHTDEGKGSQSFLTGEGGSRQFRQLEKEGDTRKAALPMRWTCEMLRMNQKETPEHQRVWITGHLCAYGEEQKGRAIRWKDLWADLNCTPDGVIFCNLGQGGSYL